MISNDLFCFTSIYIYGQMFTSLFIKASLETITIKAGLQLGGFDTEKTSSQVKGCVNSIP